MRRERRGDQKHLLSGEVNLGGGGIAEKYAEARCLPTKGYRMRISMDLRGVSDHSSDCKFIIA